MKIALHYVKIVRAAASNIGVSMFIGLILFLFIVFLPSAAFAWGPITHVYFANEVLYLGSFLPPAIYGLIRKYRQDFVYGNFMADMIIGKKYVPAERNPHSWPVALDILDSACNDHERAFSLGYLSHLAADTVAHNVYTLGSRNLEHVFLEMRADSLLDQSYWGQAVSIAFKVQRRNDAFLEKSLDSAIFSFKTNRRIFKGVVALSGLNRQGFFGMNQLFPMEDGRLEGYHEESIDRIMDVLQNGRDSSVLENSPIGKVRKGKLLKVFIG